MALLNKTSLKHFYLFIFFVAVLFKPVFSQQVILTGKVLNNTTSEPIANASVMIKQYKTKTDTAGKFVLNVTQGK